LGFAVGLGVDHLVPRLGEVGLVVGGLVGAAGSAYVMITQGRRLIETSGLDKEN
jgi:hypothetical protein